MIAFVFPGQGSQKRGMGEGLFDELPEYIEVEQEVDRMLGYSLRKLCLEDSANRLKQTEFTQPALYVVNSLHYYKALRMGVQPGYLAGHSLGEYNALLAAGSFDLLTGLRLVRKRGELMSRAKSGGMAAVIGLSAAEIAKLIADNALESIDIANFNSPSQVVLSGPVEDISRAVTVLERGGARMCIPLPVSAAFHSRYMREAAKDFAEFLAPFSFFAPRVPVVANATGAMYPMHDPSSSIKALLVKQISDSVRWTESIRTLLRLGVTQFKEIGPGNVLTRLVQQIQMDEESKSVSSLSSR